MKNYTEKKQSIDILNPDIEADASEIIEEEIDEEIDKERLKDIKIYSFKTISKDYKKIGETPLFDERNYIAEMTKKHMTPKNIYGILKVLEGELQFVWNDEKKIYTIDKQHPMVIEPERYHHIIINEKVKFYLELYENLENNKIIFDREAKRPAKQFI